MCYTASTLRNSTDSVGFPNSALSHHAYPCIYIYIYIYCNSEIQFKIYLDIKFSCSNDLTPDSAVVEKIFALPSDCKTRVFAMESD